MPPALFFLLLTPSFLNAQPAKTDVWKDLRFLVGQWEGTGVGESGISVVEREYEFILGGTFLLAKNKSTYEPQEKNPKGEVHEDWGVYSRDRARKLFILRQFNIEGFVNHYVLDTLRTDTTAMVFLTEAIENIPKGWRGRETYRILNRDEFVETFDLAGPGKDFEVYSENKLKRIRK